EKLRCNIMQHACSLEPDFVHRAENVIRAGFCANEHAGQTAAAHQLDVFISSLQKEIRCGLNTPLESLARFDDAFRDIDSALTIDKKVIVDDIDQIEPEPLHQFHDFNHHSRGRQRVPSAAVEACVRAESTV